MISTVPMSDADPEVLHRYYADLMAPAFPADELMSWEEFSLALRRGSVDGLLALEDASPVAGLLLEPHAHGDVVLLSYLVVAPALRSRGLGADLIHSAVGDDPRLVLAEIEDPRFYPPNPLTGDPVKRARFYDRIGSRLVPIPYSQPSLRRGSPRVRNLLLITIPSAWKGGAIPGALLRRFLDEYYSTSEGKEALDDPEYQSLRSATDDPELALAPLAELDAARTGADPLAN